ncbi:dipeptidase [Microtetraspora sp. NBRC 13810]|uniref:M20/M25/M40 family metallo-hydrolase n=1 Tax=Microtetraspora sp. NBRC 13810 TaxID=3030990 RepID=UPI0024A26937|nr:M20/M25/M40 family metallo-hydrolase [Microtetraspora sp. NBRC 13810]GLW05687.1 dipeptidase [Microtetraspora sp. NBRC 13810]
MRDSVNDDLRRAVREVLPGVRADLDALIRIPSVSADPAAAGDVRRCAELTARLFLAGAAREVEILDDVPGGRPVVVATCPAPPGRPTVLLYAHYDVQPAGDPAAWSGGPFEPWESGGRLYGRGSADDKAGIAVHLAALRAYGGRPPVGVVVIVEGEEEIGSPTLGAFLDRHRARLAADVIVLADSENFEAGVPSFTTTLRGLANCVVEVRTLAENAHSGTYGGAAPDALTALCRLLATLHDEHGHVAVDGLVTGRPPQADYPAERFRAEAGVLDGVGLLGSGGVAERVWAGPAATVLAIDAPAVPEAANALTASARAKVSLRVAPGDDAVRARAALAGHLRAHAPWGARVEVTEAEVAQPYAVDTRGPAFEAARRAYRRAFGGDVVDVGGGGAIPFVAEFAAACPDAAILITSPGGDPAARAHGVDENLHLADFEQACLAEALLLAELANGVEGAGGADGAE